jgi:methanogenic corrinoid protein MtbC1
VGIIPPQGTSSLFDTAALVAAAADIWLNRYGSAAKPGQRAELVYDIDQLLCHADAATVGGAAVLAEYVAWSKARRISTGDGVETVRRQLECLAEVLAQGQDGRRHLLAEALCRFDAPAEPAGHAPAHPLDPLARKFTDVLLQGERQTAERMVQDAINAGTTVSDIYVHVFQPALRRVGELWQMNKIGVADEHCFSAAVQMMMSRLHHHVFAAAKSGPRVLAVCAGGELHQIGMRMVADMFEMAGLPTDYLGADLPAESVVEFVTRNKPALIAISATLASHLPPLCQLIAALRDAPGAGARRIMVGGHPFNADPELWRRVGADGYAPDAESAVALARQMLAVAA